MGAGGLSRYLDAVRAHAAGNVEHGYIALAIPGLLRRESRAGPRPRERRTLEGLLWAACSRRCRLFLSFFFFYLFYVLSEKGVPICLVGILSGWVPEP